ncbi:MAG: preprotein translocase subunit YajC [Verrucomicrobia bacterium]|nr:preprotein translocase subunit YajC [Verrucomicrobiota bacterium]
MEIVLNNHFLTHFAQASGNSGMTMVIFWFLILGAMWFFLVAPQRKKQKQQQKMIEELNTGDNIITASGIFGTITNVKDDRFVVRIAENTKVEIQKSSVQGKIDPDSGKQSS